MKAVHEFGHLSNQGQEVSHSFLRRRFPGKGAHVTEELFQTLDLLVD
jgi:hypothetical protein